MATMEWQDWPDETMVRLLGMTYRLDLRRVREAMVDRMMNERSPHRVWTLESFARRAGMSRMTLWRLRTGQSVNRRTLMNVLAVCRLSWQDVLTPVR